MSTTFVCSCGFAAPARPGDHTETTPRRRSEELRRQSPAVPGPFSDWPLYSCSESSATSNISTEERVPLPLGGDMSFMYSSTLRKSSSVSQNDTAAPRPVLRSTSINERLIGGPSASPLNDVIRSRIWPIRSSQLSSDPSNLAIRTYTVLLLGWTRRSLEPPRHVIQTSGDRIRARTARTRPRPAA